MSGIGSQDMTSDLIVMFLRGGNKNNNFRFISYWLVDSGWNNLPLIG